MRNELAQSVLARIRCCLPEGKSYGLHEPWLHGNEWRYLKDCLDSGWVSTAGKFVGEFEDRLTEVTGISHAIATVNGTAALHVCLQLAGVATNDEVIVPTLTFVATANAVSYCGAVPHFADSSEKTLGLDPIKLTEYLEQTTEIRGDGRYNRATGRRIRAVMPMHTFGHPVDIDSIESVCAQFGLVLLEDAAEALGSLYRGQHVGRRGLMSALSFNGNKIVTTGGGGAVLTNDAELARSARHLTTTARVASNLEFMHDTVGYNYRMPNLNAALGLAQIEQLDDFLERKRALAAQYSRQFEDFENVRVFQPPSFACSNYWLNTLILRQEDLVQRGAILETLNAGGIEARPAWRLMHRLPMYSGCPRMDLSIAESLEKRIINVPSSAFLAGS